MALLETPKKNENFYAPDFTLKNIDGTMISLADVKGENGTLVMFICNHCPYVKGIADRLGSTMEALQGKGVGVVAIMPNNAQDYPADSFEKMKVFAEESGFTFPYLIDETQEIGKAYGAVCTPDFFGFNARGQLQYRGRLDDAGHRAASADTVPELLNAMSQIAAGYPAPTGQTPSMGCSIKWK